MYDAGVVANVGARMIPADGHEIFSGDEMSDWPGARALEVGHRLFHDGIPKL